ncbi:CRISPR-associated protein Cas4 [Fervidobacterium gondwanense]|uniref:CRISPR-associated protein Cas4 n=1 Tax=Fervidobacterium gondwanense TaxID=44754 RepID=UPI003A5ECFFF
MTGSLIQAYLVCNRQAWLLAHQIIGEQDNDLMSIGRVIDEESYSRSRKKIILDSGIIDVVSSDKGNEFIIEVKKSSRMLKSAELQLLLYMRETKIKYGEIRIPKEKKVIRVELSDEKMKELETLEKKIEELLKSEKPPRSERKSYCNTCSFELLCWS